MKRIVIYFLSLTTMSCFWLHPKMRSGLEGQQLPNFPLQKDSTTVFNTSSIAAGKPFVLFLYNPDCHYCNEQIADIVNDMKVFSKIDLYLITSASQHYSNFIFVRDSASLLLNYFNAPGVPYPAFYDNKKKLKEVSIGKNDINKISDIVANK